MGDTAKEALLNDCHYLKAAIIEESTVHMHKIVIALEQEKAAFLLGLFCSVFQQLPCSYTALRALAIIRQTPAVQVETAAAAAAI